MPKSLLYEDAARLRLMRGVDRLADLAGRTFGPLGRRVLVARGAGGPPLVIQSGRDLARRVELDDPFENMGVRALSDAASKVFSAVGDGTTTTILLTRRMLRAAFAARRVGVPFPRLRDEMFGATVSTVQVLGEMALPCDSTELLRSVARSAAQGDDEIAASLTSAIAVAGADKEVFIELGSGVADEVSAVSAHEVARGFAASHFPVADSARPIVLEDALVFVCGAVLQHAGEIQRPLAAALAAGRPLLVVASEVRGEALSTLAINHAAARVRAVCLTPPLSADGGHDVLADLAILTGAELLPEPALFRGAVDLGGVERAVIEPERTRLHQPRGDRARIAMRIRGLARALESGDLGARSPSAERRTRESYEARLATLRGPCVVVRVGARTELELSVRFARYESAYAATRAARDEGIAVGGGAALVHALSALVACGELSAGARVVAAGLGEPFRVIAASAGDRGASESAIQHRGSRIGLDAEHGVVTDLVACGVVDPVRVVRLALATAVGVTATIMDTAVLMARLAPDEADTFDPRIAADTREDTWRAPAAPRRSADGERTRHV